MDACRISIYLAYAMTVYCLSSIYYLIRTRYIGTPFNNSLSPKQKKIKNESANIRRNIFYQGIAGSLVILFFYQPFSKCV